MMEGLTRKDDDDESEAAIRSMAESSALLNKTLQFMFSTMQRSGNIHYQSSNPPGFTADNWFYQSQFSPPLTPTHARQPPRNIQNSTILTLMGTLMGNITSEYLPGLKFCFREFNM